MSSPAGPRADDRIRWAALFGAGAILVASLVAVALSGGATDPSGSDLLDRLELPPWQPPDSVFGPVWTVLYLMIAVSFAVAMRSGGPERGRLARSYATNIALNLAWTPLFFGLGTPLLAGLEILLLLFSCVTLAKDVAPTSRASMLLLVPYTGWVGFATFLNWTIVVLNS